MVANNGNSAILLMYVFSQHTLNDQTNLICEPYLTKISAIFFAFISDDFSNKCFTIKIICFEWQLIQNKMLMIHKKSQVISTKNEGVTGIFPNFDFILNRENQCHAFIFAQNYLKFWV